MAEAANVLGTVSASSARLGVGKPGQSPNESPQDQANGASPRAHPVRPRTGSFEIKYDGFRALAYVENRSCRLTSQKGVDYSRFKELAQGIADEVDAGDAVLDGEIVVLDGEGKPHFQEVNPGNDGWEQ